MSPRPTRKQQHAKVRREAAKRYDELAAAQSGECALCPSRGGTRRLHIDHDHKTMRVRGLLCFRCNRALPSWVSPGWLRLAADYLEQAGVAEDALRSACSQVSADVAVDFVQDVRGHTPDTPPHHLAPPKSGAEEGST